MTRRGRRIWAASRLRYARKQISHNIVFAISYFFTIIHAQIIQKTPYKKLTCALFQFHIHSIKYVSYVVLFFAKISTINIFQKRKICDILLKKLQQATNDPLSEALMMIC